MQRLLTMLCAFSTGCDRWATCEDLTDWNIQVTRGESGNEGADAHATRAPDGTLVIAISDPSDSVTFGDQLLKGPHLATVSPDGTIGTIAAVTPASGPYASVVRADANGNVVIVWSGGRMNQVVGYGADLQERWSRIIGAGYMQPLDVAPTGHVIFANNNQTTNPPTSTLVYLEPDGATRWEVPGGNDWFGRFQLADNGDVFVFHNSGVGGRRTRYAATDGAVVDEIDVPALPELTLPDGSFFRVGYNPDGSESAVLTRFDASGREVWSRTRPLRSLGNPVLSTTGDLIAQTSYDDLGAPSYKLLVLDGATGDERAEVLTCIYQNLFAADATHYYALGLIGSPSDGLARIQLP
jgi:hypothetical protein